MSHAIKGYGAGTQRLAARMPATSRHELPPTGATSPSGIQLPTREELHEIAASLSGMRFGSVCVIVQDGVVIQIDRTDKHRPRKREETAKRA